MNIPVTAEPGLETLGALKIPGSSRVHVRAKARAPLAGGVLFGLASGHRAMAPLIVLALGRPAQASLRRTLAGLASALWLGELVGDKLPTTPARTAPLPAIMRVGSGAASGWIAARRGDRSVIAGALLGAGAALLTTQLGLRLRRAGDDALPRFVTAFAEDAAALAFAIAGMSLLRPWPALKARF